MESNDEDGFKVNLDATINATGLMAVTRMTALSLQTQGYLTVGEFMKSLSDADLTALLDVIDEQKEADDRDELIDDFQNIVMLTLILTEAESVEIDTMESLQENTYILSVLLTMEGLKRKGFVELFYDKISFGDDFRKEIICRKTEKMDKWLESDENE